MRMKLNENSNEHRVINFISVFVFMCLLYLIVYAISPPFGVLIVTTIIILFIVCTLFVVYTLDWDLYSIDDNIHMQNILGQKKIVPKNSIDVMHFGIVSSLYSIYGIRAGGKTYHIFFNRGKDITSIIFSNPESTVLILKKRILEQH